MSSVDVIIPCYNYGRFLSACVDSVLEQSIDGLRVLIIDDASPDGSAAVAHALARRDPRVSVIAHRTNAGHVATYNEGLAWAASEYVMVLSADDYLTPGALKRATGLMDANPDVAFVFGAALDLLPEGAFDTESTANAAVAAVLGSADSRVVSGPDFFGLIQSYACTNVVRTPTAVVRTSAQRNVGGYVATLPHSCDLEMWLRLASVGSVGVIGAHQAVYRIHGSNMHVGYLRERSLADLRQRAAAIEHVFATSAASLPDADRLRRNLLRFISLEALACASAAFNTQEMDLVDRLSSFALETDRRSRYTLRWMALSCKRGLGVRATLMLVPLLSRIRGIAGHAR